MKPNLFGLILCISALLSTGIALYAWRRRSMPGARIIFFLMLGTSITVIAYAIELMSPSLPDKLIWVKIRYMGTALIYPMFLLLALWFTNRQKWLTAKGVAVLFVLPVFSLVALFTNNLHHFHYVSVGLDTSGPFPMIAKTAGPLYGFYAIQSFAYAFLALGILLRAYFRTSLLSRQQGVMLIIGTTIPVLAALIYLVGIRPFGQMSLLPFAYTVTSLTFAWAILNRQLLDLRPIARGMIFESMPDGSVVLNSQLSIVDANPVAMRLLNLTPDFIGQHGNKAFLNSPPLVRLIHTEPHSHIQVEIGEQFFDASRTSLFDDHQNLIGHLISLRDITERKRMEEQLRESEERYRRVSSIISDVVYSCKTDEGGNFLIDWMTGATERISGYSVEEIKSQKCWRFLVVEKDLPLFEEKVTGLPPGSHGSCELRIRRKDGEVVWIDSYAECVKGPEDSGCLYLYGGLIDINERKQAVDKIQASEARLRSISNNLPDGMIYQVVIKPDGTRKFTFVSESVKKLHGITPEEALADAGRIYSRVHEDDIAKVINAENDAFKTLSTFKMDIRMKDPSGEIRWSSLASTPTLMEDGATRWDGIELIITDRKQAEEQIHHMATHDLLTDLPSLRLAKDRLSMSLLQARRNKNLTAIMFIDLDDFKTVNDTLGHEAGDYVLQQVANRLLSCVRESDTVSRFGGDEFLIIANGIHAPENASQIADNIIRLISQPIIFNGKQTVVGTSIGIALYPDDGEDANQLIKQADEAMYRTKNAGKNSFSFANTGKR